MVKSCSVLMVLWRLLSAIDMNRDINNAHWICWFFLLGQNSWFRLWLQISSGSFRFASALFPFHRLVSPKNILRRLGLGQSRRSGRWKPGFTADLIPPERASKILSWCCCLAVMAKKCIKIYCTCTQYCCCFAVVFNVVFVATIRLERHW